MKQMLVLVGGTEMYVPINERLGKLMMQAHKRLNYQKHIAASEKILQYKAALLALKRKGLTKDEARVLYTMRGRILRSIVEPETIGGVNYGA